MGDEVIVHKVCKKATNFFQVASPSNSLCVKNTTCIIRELSGQVRELIFIVLMPVH